MKFRFSPFISALSIALAAIMFTAASWQWRRYHYKVDLLESYEQLDASQPIPFPSDAPPEVLQALKFKKAIVSCTYDYEREVAIANRRGQSGPGFWLFTPCRIEKSELSVFISRGFIPFEDGDPSRWGKYHFTDSETFHAVVQPTVPARTALVPIKLSGENSGRNWKWAYPDLEKIAAELPYPVITSVFLQRLGKPPHGTFPEQSITVDVPPSTHFGYTIEWILLGCATLAIGTLLQLLPRKKRNVTESVEPVDARMLHGILLFLTGIFLTATTTAFAIEDTDAVKQAARIDEKLGAEIDLSLSVTNEKGEVLTLRDIIIPDRPIIIAPVYFHCPRLCGLTQTGIAKALNATELKLNQDFRVLSVSFDSTETKENANSQAKQYRLMLKDQSTASGWYFLNASKETNQALFSKLGFHYAPDKGEFIHSAVLILLSPSGKISRYLYGIEFRPEDLRYSLIEASKGKIGSAIDKILLYCFRYDDAHGRYTFAVMNVTRVVCLGIFFTLAGFLLWTRRKEIKREEI